MGIVIEENTETANFMGKENICGQMARVMKDSLKKASVMGKEAGNLHKIIMIYTSAGTKETKRMAMAGIFGPMAALTKENFPMT